MCVSLSDCVFVCMAVCMHVCVGVCVCVGGFRCVHVCRCVCVCVCVGLAVCMYVGLYACVSVCFCVFLCVGACLHVFVCVCVWCVRERQVEGWQTSVSPLDVELLCMAGLWLVSQWDGRSQSDGEGPQAAELLKQVLGELCPTQASLFHMLQNDNSRVSVVWVLDSQSTDLILSL